MNMSAHRPLWIFDLDGTLIGSIRSDVLRPGAVELLDALTKRGSPCALWSAGGADYARRMAERHGLADRFVGFASKSGRRADGRWDAPSFGSVPPAIRRVYVDDAPAEVPIDGVTVPVRQFMGGNASDGVLHDLATHIETIVGADDDG
jgi:phosphoglycolate phosphatase-like HAD superfamily hydrolase